MSEQPFMPPKWLMDAYVETLKADLLRTPALNYERPKYTRRQRIAHKWEYYRHVWLHDKLFPGCEPW